MFTMKATVQRTLASFLLFCVLWGALISPASVVAREIEATDEWQLLGENDTVPAGLHIRMDITTGEKWVKKIDPNEQEAGSKVDIDQDGTVTETTASSSQTALQLATTENNPAKEKEVSTEEGDYDFDMMHRTLAQLPPEEHERMGGLPELPSGKTVASLSPHEREMFELRMRQIWKQRQEELRRIEEENVADLPQILKDRIQKIRDYLHDPVEHILSQQLTLHATGDTDDGLDTIIGVLEDLEYLLTDLDMARDFYTLGGWPLLGSLLSTDVHGSVEQLETILDESNGTAPVLSKTDYIDSIHFVQATAAWALGTAVKNTGEFIPWTVEGLKIGSKETNTLELLQEAFVTSLTYDEQGRTKTLEKLQQKVLYALGSFLRGNTLAQFQFATQDGPTLLAHSVDLCANDNYKSKHCIKMTQRVLSLASDILRETQQLQQDIEEAKKKGMDGLLPVILQAFADKSWCDAALRALEGPRSLQSKALESIPSWDEQCQWSIESLKQVLQPILDELSSVDEEAYHDELTIIKRYL